MKKIIVAIGLFGLCCLNSLQSQVVSTFAGPLGMQGDQDGVGTSASFFYPDAIHQDASGNIYVADNGRNTIRKITPTGVVTTFAGAAGQAGYVDGTGATARFSGPKGICVTPSGTIYVADVYNSRIRQITPSGVVTTFAGSGAVGSTDGTGTAASFNGPTGMCSDPSGNLYVVEPNTSKIRKITPSAVVSTFAASSSFSNARAICSDAGGNIYVACLNDHKIIKITPAGIISTFAGSGTAGSTDATGTAASFSAPYAVCADISGNIYVTDRGNYKVRKITPSGVVTTLAGSGIRGVALGIGTSASFNPLTGICADASGNIFVSSEAAIRKITSAGVVSTFAGGGGHGAQNLTGNDASFTQPEGLCSDASGNIYVADASNNKIRKITPSASVSTFAGIAGSGSTDGTTTTANFYYPTGVCFDPSGNMFVVDRSNHKIRKITPAGVVSTFAGGGPGSSTDGTGTAASFNYPTQACSDASGNIYVADQDNHKIRKITPAGMVSTFAGSGVAGSTDATGIAASFNQPYGICADVAGNIYVSDTYNNKIRKITPAGVVTTLAGSGIAGYADGTGTGATFGKPYGICSDATGNIFVVDYSTNLIRKVTSGGVVTTIAGSGLYGCEDGNALSATFAMIYGICVDPSGNIFVSVRDDSKIRKISVPCTTPLEPVDITPIANTKVCAGNTTTLTATSTGTVNWFTTPTGSSAIATGTTITTSSTLTAGTYTYYAEATTCTVSVSRTAITFTVNPAPVISVNNGSICSGKTFTIVAAGANTYSITGGSFNVSPTATTNYSVTGTSTQGCISSIPAVSTVSVNLTPTITANSGAICAGKTFTVIPGGASTYTITGGSFNVTPTATTNYSVTGTSAQGCAGSNTAVSSVTVNALPVITVTSSQTMMCVGQTATLTAGGGITYAWNTGSTGSMLAVSPTATSNYTVTGTSSNGCSAMAGITQNVSLCTGIEDHTNVLNGVMAYPNPNNGVFTLSLPVKAQVVVLNTLGQIIMADTLEAGMHTIDIQQEAPGMYLVKISLGNQQYNSKIIKN